jgi:uncharacterized protein (DUF2249 family)
MTEKQVLDVRGLSCPEPADLILQAINDLAGGQYLEVLHYQEPRLFFPMLTKRGFEFVVRKNDASGDAEPGVRIIIWRRQDAAARNAAAADS